MIFDVASGRVRCTQGADSEGRIRATLHLIFVFVLLFSSLSLGISISAHRCMTTPMRLQDANLHRIQCCDGSVRLTLVVLLDGHSSSGHEISVQFILVRKEVFHL
jgi:hypothetical protein